MRKLFAATFTRKTVLESMKTTAENCWRDKNFKAFL
jgi:hypothetical protein